MSNPEIKEITCPKCGKSVSAKIWTSVNVTLNPELREKVLSEELFDWSCPECNYESQIFYPCLYNDLESKFMIYLIPDKTKSELSSADAIEEKYPQLAGVQKRLVSNLNMLKEKILLLENGLDDKGIELTKLALAEVVAAKNKKNVLAGYFCILQQEENHIGFYFFLDGEDEPIYQGTRIEAYQKCCEIVAGLGDADTAKQGFLKIDTTWASEMMEKFKNQ